MYDTAMSEGLADYGGAFEPGFRLERLSHAALARLGREYMLFGHIRDRALMPAVGIRFGPPEIEALSILEWMGASPIYTQRMRRAMNIRGDDMASLMKSLQLDVGFPHRYMDVRYHVENERLGYFWLDCCGALLDVEPFGEKQVTSMCHAIEDPTFDATAYATNPQARMRPVHRPPRTPADRMPHCRWEIAIDPANPPAPEPAPTRAVARARVASFEFDPPDCADGEGWPDYAGEFDPDFRLERLSRRALVIACKEFALQSQLLARSAMLALAERHGEPASRELHLAQWRGLAPLSTRRICAAAGIAGDDAAALLKMLQVHPIFPPDYTRWGFELLDPSCGRFWLRDCEGCEDEEPRGFLSLLDDPACPGLDAMVQAVNPRARCRPVDPSGHPGARLAWEVRIDEAAAAAEDPPESAFLARSTVTSAQLED